MLVIYKSTTGKLTYIDSRNTDFPYNYGVHLKQLTAGEMCEVVVNMVIVHLYV